MTAITDSGTSELVLPTPIYELVYTYISDCCGLKYSSYYGGYVFPFSKFAKLPTIDLLYGGYWM